MLTITLALFAAIAAAVACTDDDANQQDTDQQTAAEVEQDDQQQDDQPAAEVAVEVPDEAEEAGSEMVKIARRITEELDNLEKRLRDDDEIHDREGQYFLERRNLDPETGYDLSRSFSFSRKYVADVSKYGGDSDFLEELCASDAYHYPDATNREWARSSDYQTLQDAVYLTHNEEDSISPNLYRDSSKYPPYIAATFSIIIDIRREILGAYEDYLDSCEPNWIALRDTRKKAEAEAAAEAAARRAEERRKKDEAYLAESLARIVEVGNSLREFFDLFASDETAAKYIEFAEAAITFGSSPISATKCSDFYGTWGLSNNRPGTKYLGDPGSRNFGAASSEWETVWFWISEGCSLYRSLSQ